MTPAYLLPPLADEYAAFLRGVAAAPDCDTPRLVLADWLEEHAGTMRETCATCEGARRVPLRRMGVDYPRGGGESKQFSSRESVGCPDCKGDGSRWVSNGCGERAQFLRDSALMGRHTDCPVRVADVARGRPVPHRCGECEYCQARRRCEAFRHDWIPGVPHSYMLETSPLDGEWPAPGYGVHAVIRRGFVDTVRGPLAVLLGEPCGRCEGTTLVERDATDPSRHIRPIVQTRGGRPVDPCPDCHGTGRTPGALERMGAELLAVRQAEVTDSPPMVSRIGDGGFIFWRESEARAVGDLPADLFDVMWKMRPDNRSGEAAVFRSLYFDTEAAARAALSHAVLALARRRAGLEAAINPSR